MRPCCFTANVPADSSFADSEKKFPWDFSDFTEVDVQERILKSEAWLWLFYVPEPTDTAWYRTDQPWSAEMLVSLWLGGFFWEAGARRPMNSFSILFEWTASENPHLVKPLNHVELIASIKALWTFRGSLVGVVPHRSVFFRSNQRRCRKSWPWDIGWGPFEGWVVLVFQGLWGQQARWKITTEVVLLSH